jgi:hypothetical protein
MTLNNYLVQPAGQVGAHRRVSDANGYCGFV